MESLISFWAGLIGSSIQTIGFVVNLQTDSNAAPILAFLSSALFLHQPKVNCFFELGCLIPPTLLIYYANKGIFNIQFVHGRADPLAAVRLFGPMIPIIVLRRMLG